jgi:hypothetical protein
MPGGCENDAILHHYRWLDDQMHCAAFVIAGDALSCRGNTTNRQVFAVAQSSGQQVQLLSKIGSRSVAITNTCLVMSQ